MKLIEHRKQWISEDPKTRSANKYAKMLGFSRQYVHHWIENGCIPRPKNMKLIEKRTNGMVTASSFYN